MKQIEWAPQARVDLCHLDRMIAQRVFRAVDRFAQAGQGDVQRLHGPADEFRLRVGDWRVRFTLEEPEIMRILRVRHRSQAYR